MVASTNNATGEPRFDGITSVLRADLGTIVAVQHLGRPAFSVNYCVRCAAIHSPSRMRRSGARSPSVRRRPCWYSPRSAAGRRLHVAVRSEEIGTAPEPPVQSWEQQLHGHRACRAVRDVAWRRALDPIDGRRESRGYSANNRLPQEITDRAGKPSELYQEAQSLTSAQRATEAIPVFQRAVQVDPQFAMALMARRLFNARIRAKRGFEIGGRQSSSPMPSTFPSMKG